MCVFVNQMKTDRLCKQKCKHNPFALSRSYTKQELKRIKKGIWKTIPSFLMFLWSYVTASWVDFSDRFNSFCCVHPGKHQKCNCKQYVYVESYAQRVFLQNRKKNLFWTSKIAKNIITGFSMFYAFTLPGEYCPFMHNFFLW